jgi:hypothetical protein
VTVTLAYLFTPEGDAALAAALEEAQRRSSDVLVVNVTRPATGEESPYSEEQKLDADNVFGNAFVDRYVGR